MLWVKAAHIIFVVTWFAGLFYLPRLFVYHAEASEPIVRERLKIMERRLMVMTHIGGGFSVLFGVLTLLAFAKSAPGYMQQHWLQIKLLLAMVLIGYHFALAGMTAKFARDANRRSVRWLRWFNEVPAFILIAIVILVIVRPI